MKKNTEQTSTATATVTSAQALEKEDAAFQAALKSLARGCAMRRRALCAAFRLSLNAAVYRADTTRLNALCLTLEGDPDASRVRKAAVRFAGGIARDSDAAEWRDDPAMSILAYTKKAGWTLSQNKSARENARVVYALIKDIDFDCLTVKNRKAALDCKAELTRLAKRFQKEKILCQLGREFLEFAESKGLIEQ